jgi:hypothetical protein
MSAEVGENAIDIALKVASAFTAVGAEYFLGGSLASSLQGEPRATNDIDFVIALPAGRIHALRDALGTDFEVNTDMQRDAVLWLAGCYTRLCHARPCATPPSEPWIGITSCFAHRLRSLESRPLRG